MKKISLRLSVLLTIMFPLFCPGSAQSQSLTMTTYYPAPFGAYDRLRLVPRSAAGMVCNDATVGTSFTDSNGNALVFCGGNPPGWRSGISPWVQKDDDIYPSDTATNPNLFVGIGTTSPEYPLHIAANDPDMVLDFSAAPIGNWATVNFANQGEVLGELGSSRLTEDMEIAFDQDDDGVGIFKIGKRYNDGNPFMTILNSGNVGIGITDPQRELHVNGSAKIEDGVSFRDDGQGYGNFIGPDDQGQLYITGTMAGNDGWTIGGRGGPDDGELWITTHDNGNDPIVFAQHAASEIPPIIYERMRIAKNGNVGIGTSAPLALLHVRQRTAGSADDTIRLSSFDGSRFIQMRIGDYVDLESSGAPLIINNTVGQNNHIFMVPHGSSNVSIGNWNPEERLDVTGNVRLKGDLFFRDANRTLGTQTNHQLNFITNNTNRVTITSDGDVGIGSDSPSEKLEVNGDIRIGRVTNNNPAPGSSFGPALHFSGGNNTVGYDSENTDKLWIARHNISLDHTALWVNIGDNAHVTTLGQFSSDSFTIGAANYQTLEPSKALFSVYSSGHAWLKRSLEQNSDERLKSNIETVRDPLNLIMNLRGVSFTWKADGKDARTQYGMIAQEVEKVLPDLVSEHNEYKSLNYTGFVAPLIEAVKEQQRHIEQQQIQIEELKAELEALKKAISGGSL